MEHQFDGRGLVVAADVSTIVELRRLAEQTAQLGFIGGYKIGAELAGSSGFHAVCQAVRAVSGHPLIYDHQKWGTDIPEIAGGGALAKLRSAGFDALIVFPLAGIETLKRTIAGCIDNELIPIVGGEMTHRGFLSSEGGYIEDSAPERIYRDAASLGVRAFVVPGTKPERINAYKRLIGAQVDRPTFFFPGIGRGQGGDIADAFRAAAPYPCYAIVGRGIYAEPDPADAARRLWSAI